MEIKWLGFNSSDNTFQDSISLYEDPPLSVRRCNIEEVTGKYTKESLLQPLRKHGKNGGKKIAKKKRTETKKKKYHSVFKEK
eukprot:snap_masked-scaffold_10-processed-gene-8.11-mRNA-1 protein AED:1.00 eAED:1.00 QI:0/-1/0/0/-1/1/1/0/81